MKLSQEKSRAAKMLKGKLVRRVLRIRRKEFGLELDDGTRLFLDWEKNGISISITQGSCPPIA